MTGGFRLRRFWTEVAVVEAGEGWAVHLDGRSVRTPDKAELAVPSRALAEALAAEWAAQEGEIKPERMPFTRSANVAIDRLGAAHGAVSDMLADYGRTDLLCYRAEGPEALAARQSGAWDPWLAWAETELRAPLVLAQGIMPVTQPPTSLSRLREAVAAHDRFEIAALHDLVTLSGSLVLGLAVSRGALAADAAWVLSRIDESWQSELWGDDAEAAAAADEKKNAFVRADRFLELVRSS